MESQHPLGQSQFLREITEQPETLTRLLTEKRAAVEGIAEHIRAYEPKWIAIAARGSSDNAARYARYLFGAHNRLSVSLAVPALTTLYKTPPSVKGALVIGISQSGQSPDIVAVIDEAHRQGAATLVLTNDPASPLGQAADHCLDLHAGEEHAVAATKTYTNSLLALAMLSAALEKNPSRWSDMALVPTSVAKVIERNRDLEPLTSRFRYASRFLVVGRGFNYSTAFEIALKIAETSQIIAEPYSAADLLHGPVAMIDRGFPVFLVAPTGIGQEDIPSLLALLEERQAEVVGVSDQSELLARLRRGMRLPNGVPEWLSPITAVVPGQLFALSLALTMGLDPDRPRGLSKVTRTL